MTDSENFPAGERFKSVNAESSDREEGESQPESQSSSNTRDEIYRLDHVVLLKYLISLTEITHLRLEASKAPHLLPFAAPLSMLLYHQDTAKGNKCPHVFGLEELKSLLTYSTTTLRLN